MVSISRGCCGMLVAVGTAVQWDCQQSLGGAKSQIRLTIAECMARRNTPAEHSPWQPSFSSTPFMLVDLETWRRCCRWFVVAEGKHCEEEVVVGGDAWARNERVVMIG